MYICASVIILLLGLLWVFGKDIAWDIQEWSNSLRGAVSERTPQWENTTTIGGIFFVMLGIIGFFIAINMR